MKQKVSRLILAGAVGFLLGLPAFAAELPPPVSPPQELAACPARAASGDILGLLEPKLMPTECIGAPDECECICAFSGEPNCLAKCG